LETADEVQAAFTQELATSEVNQVLEKAVQAHPPPVRGGFRPKIRYGHQGGRRPPTIVIHGNRTESLPKNYRKYLTNQFRRAFHLEGVPLRLELRTQDNPYQGKPRGRRPRKNPKKTPGKRR
jgi:GTP-binding protein